MKNIVDIYESIFNKDNKSAVGKNIDSLMVPTVKDFEQVGSKWHIIWRNESFVEYLLKDIRRVDMTHVMKSAGIRILFTRGRGDASSTIELAYRDDRHTTADYFFRCYIYAMDKVFKPKEQIIKFLETLVRNPQKYAEFVNYVNNHGYGKKLSDFIE